jgi:hypothetical protein
MRSLDVLYCTSAELTLTHNVLQALLSVGGFCQVLLNAVMSIGCTITLYIVRTEQLHCTAGNMLAVVNVFPK